MKVQEIFDITIKFTEELIASSLGDSPFYKGIAAGASNALRKKGSQFFLESPFFKALLGKLSDLRLYDVATGEVDSEGFFAFAEGYVDSGALLPVWAYNIPNSDLKKLVKKLKEADDE